MTVRSPAQKGSLACWEAGSRVSLNPAEPWEASGGPWPDLCSLPVPGHPSCYDLEIKTRRPGENRQPPP